MSRTVFITKTALAIKSQLIAELRTGLLDYNWDYLRRNQFSVKIMGGRKPIGHIRGSTEPMLNRLAFKATFYPRLKYAGTKEPLIVAMRFLDCPPPLHTSQGFELPILQLFDEAYTPIIGDDECP